MDKGNRIHSLNKYNCAVSIFWNENSCTILTLIGFEITCTKVQGAIVVGLGVGVGIGGGVRL